MVGGADEVPANSEQVEDDAPMATTIATLFLSLVLAVLPFLEGEPLWVKETTPRGGVSPAGSRLV